MRILVAQLTDKGNNNAQILNTRALLSRVLNKDIEWVSLYYNEPDPSVQSNPHVKLIKLWRKHLWYIHKFLFYQKKADAIFYPGGYWFDGLALQLRKLTGRKIPVIATLEGLGGNEEREKRISEWAGHDVFCQKAPKKLMERIDRILHEADHIIAISPFLADIGMMLYGDKFSVLPLGIDSEVFHTSRMEKTSDRFTAVCVGSFQKRKRPEMFIELAKKNPLADFVWYGEGDERQRLRTQASEESVNNVYYPGQLPNIEVADIFRNADLFILPSNSEGVPKVTQEAAACGLPVIVFGYYETPTVKDGINGYVVWNNKEFFERVEELIANPKKAEGMGEKGSKMAKEWTWEKIAPQWENELRHRVQPKKI